MATFWPVFSSFFFPHQRPSPVVCVPLLHGFPDTLAAGYLSQHGQVQETGPKLDLNQSLYSMAQSESEYDQASLSLPPE